MWPCTRETACSASSREFLSPFGGGRSNSWGTTGSTIPTGFAASPIQHRSGWSRPEARLLGSVSALAPSTQTQTASASSPSSGMASSFDNCLAISGQSSHLMEASSCVPSRHLTIGVPSSILAAPEVAPAAHRLPPWITRRYVPFPSTLIFPPPLGLL